MDPVMLSMMGLGIGKSIYGAIQMGRAKKAGDANERPDYDIPDEYYENVSMYEELAQEGLPQDELSRLHQQSMRGLQASLSAGLQMGGSANTVNDYYQSYLDNSSEIGLKNTLQRFSNVNQLANANNALAEQKFIEFSYDKDAPHKDRAQAATLGGVQGLQNLTGGLDTAMSGLVMGQAAETYQDAIATQNRTLGFGSTPPPPAAPDPLRIDLGSATRPMIDFSRDVPSLTGPAPVERTFTSPEQFYLHQLIKSGIFRKPIADYEGQTDPTKKR